MVSGIRYRSHLRPYARAYAYLGLRALASLSMARSGRAMSLDTKHYGVYISRATVLMQQGELKSAMMDVKQAFELAPAAIPKEGLYVLRAIIRRALKDYDGAIDDLDAAALQNGKLPAVFIQRGIARRLHGDNEGAQQDFARYLELRPTRQKYLSLQVELAEAGRLPSMREDATLAYNDNHGGDIRAGAGVEVTQRASATQKSNPKTATDY